MHPARWWHTEGEGAQARLVCDLCPHACRLAEGQRGRCRVRLARGGQLFSLVYGQPYSVALDPIEKKPLYHFLPGTTILSLGTAGCNLSCRFCQNASLVLAEPEEGAPVSRAHEPQAASRAGPRTGGPAPHVAPAELVAAARERGAPSLAFTYNEPTVFAEYALDTARAARAAGLATVLVTNGFIAAGARAELFAAIDAANVDLKFFSEELYQQYSGGRLAPVLETIGDLLRRGVHVEVTTLIVPGLNDGQEQLAAEFAHLVAAYGRDLVVHLSAFHPAHRLLDRPRTPLDTLLRARAQGRAAGLRHVYLGNVAAEQGRDTHCPDCARVLIERHGRGVRLLGVASDSAQLRCACGALVPGRFGALAVGQAPPAAL